MSEEYIVDVDHVTIRFNLASEKAKQSQVACDPA